MPKYTGPEIDEWKHDNDPANWDMDSGIYDDELAELIAQPDDVRAPPES